MLVQKFQLLLLTQAFQFACSWSPRSTPRESTSGCMDPISQPEWMPNSDCPSSLTSPSSCVSSSAYQKNCVAYCEQYLCWFLGQEVPFPDASCEPYTACTFAGQKSLSITNSYSFSGDFTAKVPVSELEAAFNLGATYTYSETSATSQTLTSTRPNGTFGDCGYWTFLPYYVASCGFYITAHNADKRLPQDEQCGGLFCETTHFTCSSDYNISFSCTNTTYLDSNGNAQGITIFVATDCASNERLSSDEQDARFLNSDLDVLYTLQSTFINATYDQEQGFEMYPPYTTSPDPTVVPTCLRGCLCGYTPYENLDTFAGPEIFGYCYCDESLAEIFVFLATMAVKGQQTLYTTPTNLSLLLFYNIDYGAFEAGLGDIFESYTNDLRADQPLWVNISEGSNLTVQRGFDCFGDYLADPLPVNT